MSGYGGRSQDRHSIDGIIVAGVVRHQRHTELLDGGRSDPGICNVIGRPFLLQLCLIRAQMAAVSVSGSSGVNRPRKRRISSRRPPPQFFTSMPYSISARLISETASDLPARMARYAGQGVVLEQE